jgi:hypothetical protein
MIKENKEEKRALIEEKQSLLEEKQSLLNKEQRLLEEKKYLIDTVCEQKKDIARLEKRIDIFNNLGECIQDLKVHLDEKSITKLEECYQEMSDHFKEDTLITRYYALKAEKYSLLVPEDVQRVLDSFYGSDSNF